MPYTTTDCNLFRFTKASWQAGITVDPISLPLLDKSSWMNLKLAVAVAAVKTTTTILLVLGAE